MCLATNSPKAKKAEKDITVYKIFYLAINEKNKEKLFSPFMSEVYPINKKYIKAKFKRYNHLTFREYIEHMLRYAFKKEGYSSKEVYKFETLYNVEDGFLHSCTTKDEAIKRLTCFACPSISGKTSSIGLGKGNFLPLIYECVIPKNTFYYKGVDELNDIASRKLKIIRKIY